MRCTECNAEVRPIVAWDIDGTLGDYHTHLLDFLAKYFNRDMPTGWNGKGDWEDYLGLTRQQYQEGKLAFRQGGFKRWMPKFDDAVRSVRATYEAGAEIWVTTTRPFLRLDSVDPDTRNWLQRWDIIYDHLLYDDFKYHALKKRVGEDRVVAVIDDLPDQYTSARAEFGRGVPILISRPHNIAFRESRDRHEVTVAGNLPMAAQFALERIQEWHRAHSESQFSTA